MQCIKPATIYAYPGVASTVKEAFPVYLSSSNTVCASDEFVIINQSEHNFLTGAQLDPNMVAAQTQLFGIVLGAVCVIWGVKQVLNLLRNPMPEN